MCRDKAHGGRRCRCAGRSRTAAYQRAMRAARRAARTGTVPAPGTAHTGRPPHGVNGTIVALDPASGRAVAWSQGLFVGDRKLAAAAESACFTPNDPVAVAAVLNAVVGQVGGDIEADWPFTNLVGIEDEQAPATAEGHRDAQAAATEPDPAEQAAADQLWQANLSLHQVTGTSPTTAQARLETSRARIVTSPSTTPQPAEWTEADGGDALIDEDEAEQAETERQDAELYRAHLAIRKVKSA